MVSLSQQQKQAAQYTGHSLVLGAAGTGKTTVLCEKVAGLLASGVEGRDIAVVLFTYKACQHMVEALQDYCGEAAEHVTIVTLRDLCLETLQNHKMETAVADGQDMRRILRYAMRAVEFSGTVREAEHIIRKFYGQLEDPADNARHASLFIAYQNYMNQYSLIDRFALVRLSLRLLQSGEVPNVPYKHLLVPHAHEATPVQLLWLMTHQSTAELTFFVDDNQHLFAQDGAVGAEMIKSISKEEGFRLFMLETNFVQAPNVGTMAENFVAGAKGYVPKTIRFSRKGKGKFQAQGYESYAEEVSALMSRVHEVLSQDEGATVAILTRHGREAQRIERVLKAKGYANMLASRAVPIWEHPGAVIVLDLLDLLFDQARPQQLMNILTSLGISHSLAQILFREGLVSEKWLAEGAPIPKGLDLPKNVFSELQVVRSRLTRPYDVLKNQQAPSKDVFKSLIFDVLQNLNEEDARDALIAAEYVLLFEGRVRDLPDVARKTYSNFSKGARIVVAPIEASRGVSADVVMIPFVNEGRFPFTGYTALNKDANHDRRLMYQALSRAKERVVISYYEAPSPFVAELRALYEQGAH